MRGLVVAPYLQLPPDKDEPFWPPSAVSSGVLVSAPVRLIFMQEAE